jgi:hypothetical protein
LGRGGAGFIRAEVVGETFGGGFGFGGLGAFVGKSEGGLAGDEGKTEVPVLGIGENSEDAGGAFLIDESGDAVTQADAVPHKIRGSGDGLLDEGDAAAICQHGASELEAVRKFFAGMGDGLRGGEDFGGGKEGLQKIAPCVPAVAVRMGEDLADGIGGHGR